MSPAAGPQLSSRARRRMRLKGLLRKELLQIVRDPSSIAIAFLLPIVLLLLFGYGVSLDAEQVPLAIVVEHATTDTAAVVGAFQRSRYFRPRVMSTMPEAEAALMRREVDGILRLRADFAERLHTPSGTAMQLIVNGSDANTARIVIGYVEGVWAHWLHDRLAESGQDFAIPVEVEQRIWFNSNLRSRNFLVPGLVAVIMSLIGGLLTALVMAREWERGTMEALLVTPVAMSEILIGKIVPYYVLGMGGMSISVVMAVWLFEVPLRGSPWILVLHTSLFLLAALGMGLLISTIAKVQFVAAQVAIIATFLPAFMLSGFIFDIRSMPAVIRYVTYLLPARYFVSTLQTSFAAGDVPEILLPNGAALLVMAAFFLGLTRLVARKRLA